MSKSEVVEDIVLLLMCTGFWFLLAIIMYLFI